MKKYELTYLISPDLSEEEAKNLSNRISAFIKEKEGNVLNTSNPVKKELAYEIKKTLEAFLVIISFSLENTHLITLKEKIVKTKNILRHIISIKRNIKETPIRKRFKKEILTDSNVKKVELGEIDQKIEEILG